MAIRIIKSFILFIIHHFIRPVWALILFGVPYFLAFLTIYIFCKDSRELINKNWQQFFEKRNIIDFIAHWNNNFKGKYKSDGFIGLFDHYNSPFEFFRIIWDCDDASYYPAIIFKNIGYKVYIIGLYGSKINSWHYDCIVKTADNIYMLFNQGNCIFGNSIDDCILKLGEKWNTFKNCVWWKCLW